MEFLQLEYFRSAARLESMTKAAELHMIPQPAMSKTISTLEKELGVTLFDRRNKRIYLNENGKRFLKCADAIFKNLDDTMRELHESRQFLSGEIRMLALESSNLVAEAIAAFKRENPNVNFTLMLHRQFGALPFRHDLCISALPAPFYNSEHIPLLSENILLAVPAAHWLAGRSTVSLRELAGERFISLPEGKSLRNIPASLCRANGFEPHIAFESDDPASVRKLLRSGLGIAFVPEISWRGLMDESISLLKIENPGCCRTIAVSWNGGGYLSRAVKEFRQFLITYFRAYAGAGSN